MNILDRINSRSDLLALRSEELPLLCRELREFLRAKISVTGGHLASNLGAVEITVALHRVYDPERDRLLFDVGHQSYIHKILTGRRDDFGSLRQFGGLSGFPKPCESDCDPFVAGHASDSVSVALGMARARTLLREKYDVVTVLGDGALTGGLSYEALADLGQSEEPMVVILNDNGMSINPSVGGTARMLSRIRVEPTYLNFKRKYHRFMQPFPKTMNAIHEGKEWLKDRLLPGNLFDSLGLYYIGPVDGHNVTELETQLRWARDMRKPVLLHVCTTKGKGIDYAEKNPAKYHGVGPFDPITGVTAPKKPDFSSVFGETLCTLAKEDERICALTAAMEDGTGLTDFSERFSERFFDVGIAEGHGAAMCGGLAKQGMIPVFAVYSSFLQRAYDMLIEDISLLGLHAVFCVDRSGLVGADGETHQGSFDAAYLSSVPGMTVLEPASFAEMRSMLKYAVKECAGPVALCYPRGGEGNWKEDFDGSAAAVLREGSSVTLVSYGVMINEALSAADMLSAEGVEAEVIKLNSLCPLDTEKVLASLRKTRSFVFAAECCRAGSPAQTILSAVAEAGFALRGAKQLDLGSGIVKQGDIPSLRKEQGIDAAAIVRAAKELLNEESKTGSAGI